MTLHPRSAKKRTAGAKIEVAVELISVHAQELLLPSSVHNNAAFAFALQNAGVAAANNNNNNNNSSKSQVVPHTNAAAAAAAADALVSPSPKFGEGLQVEVLMQGRWVGGVLSDHDWFSHGGRKAVVVATHAIASGRYLYDVDILYPNGSVEYPLRNKSEHELRVIDSSPDAAMQSLLHEAITPSSMPSRRLLTLKSSGMAAQKNLSLGWFKFKSRATIDVDMWNSDLMVFWAG